LTDEELALLCAGWSRDAPDRSLREQRAAEKLEASMPEVTIATPSGTSKGCPKTR
jgi:hypothetical protein